MTVGEFVNIIGFKVKDDDVKKVNDTISGIKNVATKVLGAISVGLSLTAMNDLVEEFGRINDQVRNSTKELGNQAEIQQKILASASATRTAYSQTASVISDLVHENKELFGDINEAVKFNNAATMLFKTAGKTNEEIAGLMEAINKSFAKGYVDSETLSQLLERSPETVELINKRLGTTSDKLEKLASDGKFTVADLKAAFVDNLAEIEAGFTNVEIRVSDTLTVIRNKWGMWLSETNEMVGLTQTISRTMVSGFDIIVRVLNQARTAVVWLNEKLGGLSNTMKLIGITAGAAFGAAGFAKIPEILKAMEKLDKKAVKAKLKLLGIAAIIVLIVLLVEDFIAFMQGRNSLFGTMLEKAGIDTEKTRDTIKRVWSSISSILGSIWNGLSGAAQTIFGYLLSFWNKWGDKVFGALGSAFGFCIDALDKFLTWLSESEQAQPILENLGAAIAVLTAIVIAWKVAAVICSVVTTILGGAFTLLSSPITLVILAIVALIAIIYLLVKNWDKVKEAGAKAWEWLQNAWSNAANWFKTTVIDPIINFFSELFTGISTTAGNIKTAIVNGLTAAIEWITSLPQKALTWGKDIILGIVNGIRSAIGKVGEVASEIADKIKSFLGFSEPEEGPLSNFHTYMPDMIDLMSKGIKEGKGKIRDALEELTTDMSIMANAKVVSGSTAGSVSNSTVNRSVIQNVEINNKFEGDRAGQQKSAAAMDKAANDVTSELARGLAYAR